MWWWPKKRSLEDFDEEIRAHLDLERKRLIDEGTSPGEAETTAHRSFGNIAKAHENFYESGRVLWLDHLWRDVRLALRSASRQPIFMVVAAGSLAVGVAATTIMFAVADTIFLRPIPGVSVPGRLVEIGITRQGSGFGPWDYPGFRDMRDEVAPLEHAAMYAVGRMSISDEESGARMRAMYISSGYFEAVGALPILGRSFSSAEDVRPGEHPVAILGYDVWQQRFDGDPAVLGSSLRLNRETYTVVGVSREDYRGHSFGMDIQVYVPISQHALARSDPGAFISDRTARWGGVLGRLRADSSLDQVNAGLETVFSRLQDTYPETNEGVGARAAAAGLAPAGVRALAALWLSIIMGLTLLVLCATCANVGGMTLARAAARKREMAIRLALGSGRSGLVRHLFAESMVVFLLGGVGGVLLAASAIRLDPNLILSPPERIPASFGLALDWRVFAFGFGLTAIVSLLFGLMPALQSTRTELMESLRDRAGSSLKTSRLRRIFVTSQVAVSVLLLTSAGLFMRALQQGREIQPGDAMDRVFITPIDLSLEGYGSQDADLFTDLLVVQLQSMPDVAGATIATDIPLDNQRQSTAVWLDSRLADPERWMRSNYTKVTPGYFEILGVELRQGRRFGREEGRFSPRVAIVNELFAERAWPDGDALAVRGRSAIF